VIWFLLGMVLGFLTGMVVGGLAVAAHLSRYAPRTSLNDGK